MGRRDALALAVTLLAVIVLPGLANYALAGMGYDTLGAVVWAVGYGSGAVFVWWAWVRPLDITGPEGGGPEDLEEVDE